MFFVRKGIILLMISAIICSLAKSSPVNQIKNGTTTVSVKKQKSDSLSNSYNELLQDVRWFFQRLEDFSSTAERILPNVSLSEQSRTISDSNRFNFLIGLRHLLSGIREISITFRKTLEAENMQQLQYVIQATNILQEAFKALRIWFSSLRTLFSQVIRIYSRHIPEVLLGKCLGRYVVAAYPERAFYEYPLLLLNDIFNTVFQRNDESQPIEIEIETSTETQEGIETDQTTTTERIPIEQNEIPHHEETDYKTDIRGRSLNDNDAFNEDLLMSFFNFNDVLIQDKDRIIDSAIEKHSWQKCFKMYTAETIVRKLKVYFLESD